MSIKFKTFPWQTDLVFNDVETIEGKPRLYLTPDGKFPSMTSILSVLDDGGEGLQRWRDRIGHEEADKITCEAGERGNQFHDYNELYLQNRLHRSDLKGQARTLFNRVKQYLDEIELMVATEAAVWNTVDQYAGRVDCIAMLHGNLTIIDHKNSRNPITLDTDWKRQKLFKYMVQTAGYAKALYDMKGIMPTHGCLIIGNHLTSTSDRYIFTLENLIPELEIVAGAYHGLCDVKESAFFDDGRLTRVLDDVIMNL